MLRMPCLDARLLRRARCLKRVLDWKVRHLATDPLATSYRHRPGKQPLLYKTYVDLVDEAAEKFPDRTAIFAAHQNERISFAQAKEKAEELAAGLVELGIEKGDRVGLWSPNCAEWYITNFALTKCGAISVYINPAYQSNELMYCLNKVGAKMLISADVFKKQDYYKVLEQIAPELQTCQPGKLRSKNVPQLETVIFLSEDQKPGSFRYKDIFGKGTAASREKLDRIRKVIEPEEAINIQFTSGTTGSPKAAILSHFATVNNSLLVATGQEFHLKEHKMCVLGPFFHAMGSVIGIMTCLHYGTPLVIPDFVFNPERAVASIMNEKCTILLGTPTMYLDIIRHLKEKNLTLTSPELAISGGAYCSPEMYKDMMARLGIKRAGWVYGLTESGPVAFMTTSADTGDKVMTVGGLVPHVEAKVVDANGATLPCNTPGELLLRGFLIMSGYWGDEEKTKEAINPEHWLKTGDQFIIDEHGYGKIVGRIKDLIIRGGENISPFDVEEFLITHPDVVDVQVVGVPDERLGEQVCACLKLKPGSKLTEEELKQYCKGKIAHFKIPYYVRFFDEFPKTASGKIQRFKLKEQVLEMLGKSG